MGEVLKFQEKIEKPEENETLEQREKIPVEGLKTLIEKVVEYMELVGDLEKASEETGKEPGPALDDSRLKLRQFIKKLGKEIESLNL